MHAALGRSDPLPPRAGAGAGAGSDRSHQSVRQAGRTGQHGQHAAVADDRHGSDVHLHALQSPVTTIGGSVRPCASPPCGGVDPSRALPGACTVTTRLTVIVGAGGVVATRRSIDQPAVTGIISPLLAYCRHFFRWLRREFDEVDRIHVSTLTCHDDNAGHPYVVRAREAS